MNATLCIQAIIMKINYRLKLCRFRQVDTRIMAKAEIH